MCFWHCTLTAGQLDSQQKEVSMTPLVTPSEFMCHLSGDLVIPLSNVQPWLWWFMRASDKSVKWDDWGWAHGSHPRTPGSLEGPGEQLKARMPTSIKEAQLTSLLYSNLTKGCFLKAGSDASNGEQKSKTNIRLDDLEERSWHGDFKIFFFLRTCWGKHIFLF